MNKTLHVALILPMFLVSACSEDPGGQPVTAPGGGLESAVASAPVEGGGGADANGLLNGSVPADGDLPPVSTESIEGSVVDGNGQPLVDIEVRAFPENWAAGREAWSAAKTDTNGLFRITGVREETHRLEARGEDLPGWFGPSWKSGHRSEPIPGIRPGARGLRLVLLPPGSVVGTTVGVDGDGSSAEPAIYLTQGGRKNESSPVESPGGVVAVPCLLEGRQLIPVAPRPGEVPYSFRVRDDRVEFPEAGRFRADGLRQGRWRLEVDDISAQPGFVEFEVRAGQETKVKVPVRRRGWVTARIRGTGDLPLAGACVVVLDAKGYVVPVLVETVVLSRFGGLHSASTLLGLFNEITTTNIGGRTERRYLDPGTYGIRVLAVGCRPFSGTLEVAAGEPSSLDVQLDPER